MKNLFKIMVIFLFLGLYIDVGTDEKWRDSLTVCNGNYLQRTFVIQTVVPFLPERETLYVGIGNKHLDRELTLYPPYCDEKTKTWVMSSQGGESGCYPGRKKNFGSHSHFIDLVWFLKPVDEPIKYQIDYRDADEEDYNYGKAAWTNQSGQSCDLRRSL